METITDIPLYDIIQEIESKYGENTHMVIEAFINDNNEHEDLEKEVPVEKIIENVFYYGKQCIKASIPICFVEIVYKTRDKDEYLITHEEHLYGDNMPDMESLKAYQKATSYGFANQVTQETKDIVEAFHNGYGCECLSSGDY